MARIYRNSFAALLLIGAPFVGAQSLSDQRIDVKVDGQRVFFPASQPQCLRDRVLVPLRGVFEEMGADVQWHPDTLMVMADMGGRTVRLHIGDRTAHIGSHSVEIDVPPAVLNGSTMVPIRFISQALGAEVVWDDVTRTVIITTKAGR